MNRPAYHHGALRDALVDAALEVVRDEGADALSLRAIARRAGVSSGAPYRHFEDRGALLRAVAKVGYERLDRALTRTSRAHRESSSLEHVQELGVTYVRFAAREPHLFRLMFAPARYDLRGDEEVDALRRRVATHLPNALGRVQADGYGADASLEELTELAWALVHGVAWLHLDGVLGGKGPKRAEELARRVTRRLGALLSG